MPIRHLFTSQTDASAPFASIGNEPRDLGLLHRYQRFTLYGGAVLLSLVMLFAASILLAGSVRDYISKRRELLTTHKALVQLEIDAKQASMRRAVINAELLWNGHPPHAKDPTDTLRRDGHVLLSPMRGATEVFVAATPDATANGEFDRYVQLMERQTISIAAAERQTGRPITGYAYSPDHRVIAITPPPNNTGKRARKWLPLRAVLWPLPFLFFLFDSNVLVYYTVRWILLFGVPMAFVLNWPRRS